jgi:hypothetical protein
MEWVEVLEPVHTLRNQQVSGSIPEGGSIVSNTYVILPPQNCGTVLAQPQILGSLCRNPDLPPTTYEQTTRELAGRSFAWFDGLDPSQAAGSGQTARCALMAKSKLPLRWSSAEPWTC